MKNAFNGLMGRLYMARERFSELEVNRNFQKWGKGRGEQEEKILMEQNTQKLWYISQGISITAVPGGKKKRKKTYLKGY